MGELNYAGLVTGIVSQLNDADWPERLGPVHVTAEPELPTTEQCPAIIVLPKRATRTPTRIVGGFTAGAPDDVRLTVQLWCWVFSAQGAQDAAFQRDELTNTAVDVIRAERTIGGRVQWADVTDIDFQWQPGGSHGSFYAVAAVTVILHAMA